MSVVGAVSIVGVSRGNPNTFHNAIAEALTSSGYEILRASCLESFAAEIYDPEDHPFNYLIEPIQLTLAQSGYEILSQECLVQFCKSVHHV